MGIDRLEGKQGSGLTRPSTPPIVLTLGFQKIQQFFFQKNQSVGLGKQGWKSLTVAQRSKSGFEPAEKTAQRLQWRNGSARLSVPGVVLSSRGKGLSNDIPRFLRTEMKKNAIAALAATLGLWAIQSAEASLITNLDDIQNWTGTGSNRAGLVIQWNDGSNPASLAWGYRWNGSATGLNMLQAIAGSWQVADSNDPTVIVSSGSGSDSRLTLGIHDFGWGQAVNSITFNDTGVSRTRSDWATGFWEYFNVGGTFDTPPNGEPNTFLGTSSYPGTIPNSNWVSSWSGFDSRILSNGSWDGWSFAPGFTSLALMQPHDADLHSSAVPEPRQIAASILTLAGLMIYIVIKRFSKTNLAKKG
jgi:hypothetical protein